MSDIIVSITCSEKDIGYWQADIVTDGNHDFVYTSNGIDLIDTLPVEEDGTIIWVAGNDTYSGFFLIGYDLESMQKVDTSQCGVSLGFPNEPQPSAILVTPAPIPTPPATDLVIPVQDGAYVIPNIIIFMGLVALIMRVIAKKL